MADEIVAEVEYRKVPDVDGLFASSDGFIFQQLENGELEKLRHWTAREKGEYLAIHYKGQKHRVHVLVLLAFVGERPQGMFGCHWNDDKTDNRPSNLRWASAYDNAQDAVRNSRFRREFDHHNTKLSDDDVRDIIRRINGGEKQAALAREYKVTKATICDFNKGRRRKHICAEMKGAT